MVSRKTTFAGLAIASTLIFASGAVGAPQATGSTTAGASQTGSLIATLPTAAPETWIHPGVFASVPQLMFVRHRVKAGAQPWSQAFTDMLADPLASANRTASPRADVDCGGGSIPDNGCSDERDDAMAAYMNALAYWFTDNTQYAEKAIYYMNAWSRTIQIHTNANKDLQAGWAAAEWVRAGEFILHSAASHLWAAADVEAFRNMLRTAYIPAIINGQTVNDGNQELVMMESAIGAAVFLEDASVWEKAMSLFAARVPAYIYLTSDGPLPVPGRGIKPDPASIIKFWHGQDIFVDGLTQETCRDWAHMSYGIASISHVAETARIQGNDLWKTQLGTRIKAALEFHSPFQTGTQIPTWLCNGTIGRSMDPVVEPPYNALAFRMNEPMPNTLKLVLKQRPAGIGEAVPLMVGWETLTNAENPF